MTIRNDDAVWWFRWWSWNVSNDTCLLASFMYSLLLFYHGCSIAECFALEFLILSLVNSITSELSDSDLGMNRPYYQCILYFSLIGHSCSTQEICGLVASITTYQQQLQQQRHQHSSISDDLRLELYFLCAHIDFEMHIPHDWNKTRAFDWTQMLLVGAYWSET